MPPQRFRLNKTECKELRACWENEAKGAVSVRCWAVYLYGTGHSAVEIISAAGCSRSTLMEWCLKYRQQGLDGLQDQRQGGNRARLTSHQLTELREWLSLNQVWTVEELRRVIFMWYGVRYSSRTSYYNIFAKCGFRYDRQLKAFKLREK